MQPIAELNELPRDKFTAALRPLFEAADPLADALYTARPFTSYEALIDKAESLTNAMPLPTQVQVLAAHPRIGANPVAVSALSYREQGYAGEAGMDPSEVASVYEELDRLNRQYEERFGFRFVVFVNKRPKSEILGVLRKRLNNSADEELHTGIRNMFLIARDRLCSLS